ncbi:MAG: methionine synthase [Bacilli bacterium]
MTSCITEVIKQRVLLMDGAMGTMIQAYDLTADDFGGEEYEGCNEWLVITRPDVISEIHDQYFAAGADIIETNTFGGAPFVLDEFSLGHEAYNVNVVAARLACESRDKYTSDTHPRWVAGSMGPTTKTLSVTGGTTFDELVANYREQARGLIDGGVDFLLLETSQDLLNVKAGFVGIQEAQELTGKSLPLMISGTIEPMGTTLAGQNIEAFFLSIEHMNAFAVGLNCATGPEFMTDHIRTLSDLAPTAISCYPNAGLPDEDGHYHESPTSLASKLETFLQKGWINIVGGCCGTTPAHIEAMRVVADRYSPRPYASSREGHAVSGIEPLLYDDSMRPLFVGERTNVIGSRKFKTLIADGGYEEAAEVGRAQVKNGAHVIDICLADPDRDEMSDMITFIQEVVKKVKVPIMIDSTDEKVIAESLKYTQGKCIINSINLEDGLERFTSVLPYVKRYGASIVVGTIDEIGMGVSAERKLDIAKRSYDILVNDWGIAPSDIIFDPLVFPVGTGDEQYVHSAKETVKGIALIREHLPETLQILGVSNVSFGLPPLGREVLNSVFLYHCTNAGLDYAIVNTEKLERFASIPKEEVAMCEELLFNNSKEALERFTNFYRSKVKTEKKPTTNLSLEERLASNIVEGTKEGLVDDLAIAIEKYDSALDVINGPLMTGMNEVGRLFNDNQLIVAEVLQSAEVMKTAVAFLEPHMEKNESAVKGKIILATVKGDVHDIGKNLVDIILSNNGFDVIDLGIKVAPQQLIEAVKREKPDMIGLSGLLVKSAQQMVITAQDFKAQGIDLPILVGGAALTRKFTLTRIAPDYDGVVLYAKDAMDGLSIANDLANPEKRKDVEAAFYKSKAEKADVVEKVKAVSTATRKDSTVSSGHSVTIPTDTKRHALTSYDVNFLRPYINMQMLLGHHLGLKGNVKEQIANKDERAVMLDELVNELLTSPEYKHIFEPKAVYQFFPAQSNENKLIIYSPEDHTKQIGSFDFPRMSKAPFYCLSDFVKPVDSGEMDYVGMFVVTGGKAAVEAGRAWKASGDFLKSHVVQSLALELAEGFAERIHQVMRDAFGISDAVDMTMEDRFRAKYVGQRFSFGYPACPNLEDQQQLFELLQPGDIGVQLTEGCMMEPEASVSAIVFSHPEARYFNV